MAELQYHRNLTLEQIARLDDVQIAYCLNLPRDRRGNLIRRNGELPEGVEVDDEGMRVVTENVGMGAAVVKARAYHGVPVEQAKQDYRDWWAREFKSSSYAQ